MGYCSWVAAVLSLGLYNDDWRERGRACRAAYRINRATAYLVLHAASTKKGVEGIGYTTYHHKHYAA